jgi:hypothetical protein
LRFLRTTIITRFTTSNIASFRHLLLFSPSVIQAVPFTGFYYDYIHSRLAVRYSGQQLFHACLGTLSPGTALSPFLLPVHLAKGCLDESVHPFAIIYFVGAFLIELATQNEKEALNVNSNASSEV